MSSDFSAVTSDLNREETELVLKALGYYQVHLFDELKKDDKDKSSNQKDIRIATSAIKKTHRLLEAMGKQTI